MPERADQSRDRACRDHFLGTENAGDGGRVDPVAERIATQFRLDASELVFDPNHDSPLQLYAAVSGQEGQFLAGPFRSKTDEPYIPDSPHAHGSLVMFRGLHLHFGADHFEHQVVAAADFKGRLAFTDPQQDAIAGRQPTDGDLRCRFRIHQRFLDGTGRGKWR